LPVAYREEKIKSKIPCKEKYNFVSFKIKGELNDWSRCCASLIKKGGKHKAKEAENFSSKYL
jgi:hypothetical protein